MKWLALLLFGGTGAAILMWGVLWGLKRYPLFRDGRRTTGKIVEQEVTRPEAGPDHPSQEAPSYFPVVEFEALGGEKIRFTGSTGGGNHPEYEVGQVVEVIYDPANPKNAQIGSFSQFWLGPVALSIFGAVFLIMGTASFFLIRGSDEALGDAFQKRVDRNMLVFQPDVLRIRGQVTNLRPNPADNGRTSILTCTGRTSENAPETCFDSDSVPAELAGNLVGRPVMILVDPKDRGKYLVDLDPLMAEASQNRPL